MRRALKLLGGLAVLVLLTVSLTAQLKVQPVGEHRGDVALRLMIRKLGSTGTFMQTTAHPDDEDNALLAKLGLGEGMRAVLVTATRGDGGQNEIGPELFQALGVLRTEEILAAHRFDGAEQYFTRAIDFGYSFSVEETLDKWGHDEILGDFVRLIRTVRPDVIAGFLCGGPGGGQHHQASARLTLEAFRAAADPARFPDHFTGGLRPWQAARVFCTDFGSFGPRRAGPTPPDLLSVAAGGFDTLLGRTFTELGIEARSMHKCQGTSQLLPLPGASFARTYRLQDTVLGQPGIAPPSMFEGIDTSLQGLTRFAGTPAPRALTQSLKGIAGHVGNAWTSLSASGPPATVAPLVAGLQATRKLRDGLSSMSLSELAQYELGVRLDLKIRQFEEALLLANGVRLEVLANDGLTIVGQPIDVSILASQHGPEPISAASVSLEGFTGSPAPCQGTIEPGGVLSCQAKLQIAEAPLSTPYWTPRSDAARYDVDPAVPFGVPFRPSPFRASVALVIAGAHVTVEREVEYRYDDVMAGEKRMTLKVVPAFAASAAPSIAVIPAGALGQAGGRDIELTVTNHTKSASTADVSLQVPIGWRTDPTSRAVSFAREDESVAVRFTVTPPAGATPGDHIVRARVGGTGNGASDPPAVGYDVIEYPHVHRRHVVKAAETHVKILDVTIAPGLRVGYVMGVGDQVPQAIRQLGAEVRLISPSELASGDLSVYDAIVTGVRAYERRPDLRAHNQRLIEYAKQGGIVLVQYNKFEFNQTQYGPYPAKVSSNRVTDEGAPVEVLAPTHPVFTWPNRIGPETWAHWVQERGLYFLGDRDSRYQDLVRLVEPFEYNRGEKSGALVEARVGKGRWIYVGLGLWRQLPAGTEGAYRLMANLLSLRKAPQQLP